MVRVRFWVTVLLLLSAVALVGATQPPRNLRLVDGHWTPYDPPDPSMFPAGSKVHIIERGDTLWDLARRFYGDAYLWPQLWELNTYIRDSHWIYPGDPLLVQGELTTGEIVTETVTEEYPETDMTASLVPATPPVAIGSESDIYCWGYLGEPDEYLPNRIVAFEDYEVKHMPRAIEQDNGVTDGDIIFIDVADHRFIQAGETYIVVAPEDLIRHPVTDATVGRHYDYKGRVRILCITDNLATAMVVQSCEPIRLGHAIKAMPLHPIPLARMTEMQALCATPSGRSEGFIVNAKDYTEALGEGNVVEINLGRDHLVEPGTFLTVFRDSPIEGNPRLILGEIGVLTAEGSTATGQIVRMRYAMRVGDRVELK